jgi:hypothetical protein
MRLLWLGTREIDICESYFLFFIPPKGSKTVGKETRNSRYSMQIVLANASEPLQRSVVHAFAPDLLPIYTDRFGHPCERVKRIKMINNHLAFHNDQKYLRRNEKYLPRDQIPHTRRQFG